ncbi:MAG: hypothetical protein H6604_09060 [Flavobacteriales bacterium]|nr:hypothetical protein [Flavobacteriales bacterium]
MSSCGTCGTSDSTLPKGCKNHGTCGTDGCNKLTVFDWLSDINTSESIVDNIVEVRFKNDRKGFYRNTSDLSLQMGDIIAVESSPGHDIGVVSLKGALANIQARKKKENLEELSKVYRIANQKDIDTWQEFRSKEYEHMTQARKMASNLNLNMKICDVEYQADGTKATFYYTAESRVDFRELIKQYATTFKTKIDMRQIGFRQESAKVGGIGSCGRELCCSSWLTDFRSVNTAAARYQQLSINPQKLAGQCGKLKCCLNFELDSYLDAIDSFPSQNTILKTEKGNANCIKIDVFRQKMWFTYKDNSLNWYEFSTAEVHDFIAVNKKGNSLKPLEEYQKTEVNTIDIIEENNLNRFENKKPNRKPRKKNKRNNTSNNSNTTNSKVKTRNENSSGQANKQLSKSKPKKITKKTSGEK